MEGAAGVAVSQDASPCVLLCAVAVKGPIRLCPFTRASPHRGGRCSLTSLTDAETEAGRGKGLKTLGSFSGGVACKPTFTPSPTAQQVPSSAPGQAPSRPWNNQREPAKKCAGPRT